ncbi:MAG: hypothetical protein JWO51_135 [Rhodospirillales bacterium]|nr:hypothetical protein [Rhodospirillales bacterium]
MKVFSAAVLATLFLSGVAAAAPTSDTQVDPAIQAVSMDYQATQTAQAHLTADIQGLIDKLVAAQQTIAQLQVENGKLKKGAEPASDAQKSISQDAVDARPN